MPHRKVEKFLALITFKQKNISSGFEEMYLYWKEM